MYVIYIPADKTLIHIQNKMQGEGRSPFHDKMLNNLENFLGEMKATKETLGAIRPVVKGFLLCSV